MGPRRQNQANGDQVGGGKGTQEFWEKEKSK